MFDFHQEGNSQLELDDLDLQLVEQLKINARESVHTIAQNLNLNRTTVRYRLNRLISEGYLKIICVAKPELLGYQIRLIVGIRAFPTFVKEVAKQFSGIPGVIDVTISHSNFNIIVYVLLKDQREFEQFICNDITNISHILSIEIMQSIKSVKEFWRIHESNINKDIESSEIKLNDLEQSIFNELQLDPRQTITKLAKSINSSRAVASAALDKLIHEGTIAFIPFLNPIMIGYTNWVIFLIKAEPSNLKQILNILVEQPETWNVSMITGHWQIYAISIFKDNTQMNNFTINIINSLPGVTEIEAIPLGGLSKFSFPPDSGISEEFFN